MERLSGKVAIVTGGARGMGASHARKMAAEGAKVVITDVLVEDGEKLAEEIGENALFIKHDVCDEEAWRQVIRETENHFGPVSVLVNNAGIGITKPIEELTLAEYKKVIDINQVGTFLGMKYTVPSMRKAEKGSIINISSMSGFRGTPGCIAYDASKFAVRGMTKTAALEFSNYGIRVNSVHPGTIETPLLMNPDYSELVEQLKEAVPLKRLGQSEDVTNVVVYLASDESGYSTGAEFLVDGGLGAKL